MGWILISSKDSDPWFRSFQSVRNYMFIMRTNEKLFEEKLHEAMTTYEACNLLPMRKLKIRYSFEKMELLKDKVLNRPVYDLNYH